MIIYTATANKSLSSTDGTLADNTGYKTSDYIKVEPSTEPEIVLEPEPEKPVDQAEEKPKNKRSKKAKAGEENQNTTASPEEPAIVTNTAETQPAQFTTIDKPVDKQEESQPTTEANNQ